MHRWVESSCFNRISLQTHFLFSCSYLGLKKGRIITTINECNNKVEYFGSFGSTKPTRILLIFSKVDIHCHFYCVTFKDFYKLNRIFVIWRWFTIGLYFNVWYIIYQINNIDNLSTISLLNILVFRNLLLMINFYDNTFIENNFFKTCINIIWHIFIQFFFYIDKTSYDHANYILIGQFQNSYWIHTINERTYWRGHLAIKF